MPSRPIACTVTASSSDGPNAAVSSWRGHAPLVVRSVLDCLIAVYTCGLASIALVGGAEFVFFSFHRAEKPLLALMMLVPIRVVAGGRSWLPDAVRATADRLTSAWAGVRPRISDAVVDTAVIVSAERAASMTVAFLANLTFAPAMPRGFSMPFANAKFVEIFAAWDSGWYWDIATHGYYFRPDGQSSIAFFPLYPMLMRLAAAPFGGGDGATWIAGIIVAFLAYVGALVAVHRLAMRMSGSRDAARRTVLLIVVFPWSLFMTRVYTESVFLLVSVLAVSAAFERRWWHAGVWGALATLARPNGILIAVPLAIFAMSDRPGIRPLVMRAFALAPIPLAFAGFCVFVYALSGDPLGWMAAQAHWGYSLGHPPWQQLQRVLGVFIDAGAYDYFFASKAAPFELLQALTALVFVTLVPVIFRRLGVAMGAYVLVSLLVPLSSNTLEGLGRYASVLFPAFMVVGSLATPRVQEALVVMSLVFRTLLLCFFVTWQPIY